MLFNEIIKMALASLGANKLRAALTMIGITIGVFSVISVMTAIGALQSSIESGISFLGSNIFQFAKYPANVNVGGKMIEKRLFQHETPIGKVVRVSGHTYTIVGVLAEKGTSFGQSQDDLCFMPITRFFEDYGEAKRTVNIATQAFSTETYNQTLDKGISAMRIARGLRADQGNDFEIYSNDSLKSAFTSVAGIVRIGAFVV